MNNIRLSPNVVLFNSFRRLPPVYVRIEPGKWWGLTMPTNINCILPSQYVEVHRDLQLIQFATPDKDLSGWVFPVFYDKEDPMGTFYPLLYARKKNPKGLKKGLGGVFQEDDKVYFSIDSYWMASWKARLDHPMSVYSHLMTLAEKQEKSYNLFARRAGWVYK